MPISIFADLEKKDIPDWKEIFIGGTHEDNISNIVAGTENDEDYLNIQKIKIQILKSCQDENSFVFNPLQFIESDLFGMFHLKTNNIGHLWVN